MALIKIVNWKKPQEFLWLDERDIGKDPRYVRWEDRDKESKTAKETEGEGEAAKAAKKQKGARPGESDQTDIKPEDEHGGEVVPHDENQDAAGSAVNSPGL